MALTRSKPPNYVANPLPPPPQTAILFLFHFSPDWIFSAPTRIQIDVDQGQSKYKKNLDEDT